MTIIPTSAGCTACGHLFEVRDGFPRITTAMFPGGVGNVHYSISLPDCEPFRADTADLMKLISQGK